MYFFKGFKTATKTFKPSSTFYVRGQKGMRQLLAFLLFLTLVTWSKAGIISGSVFFDEPYTNPYKQIVVNVYKLSLDRYGTE